jgi:hypothetical protein
MVFKLSLREGGNDNPAMQFAACHYQEWLA